MRKKLGIVLLSFGIVLTGFALIFGIQHYRKGTETDNHNETSELSEPEKDNTDYGYAFETVYSGKPYMPDILFEQPFKKTNSYVSNTEFIKAKGEKCTAPIISLAEDFTKAAFNVTYKNISNEDVLNDTLAEGIYVRFPSGKEADGIKEVTDTVNSWYVNSGTSIEAEYTTDKCMLYYDENAVILRGLLTFTVYESEDIESVEKIFGIDQIKMGEEYSVVVEYYFVPSLYSEDFESYRIAQIIFLP